QISLFTLKKLNLIYQVILNFVYCLMQYILSGHKQVCGEDRYDLVFTNFLSRSRINSMYRFNFISPEKYSVSKISISYKYIYCVAFYPEIAMLEFRFCSTV